MIQLCGTRISNYYNKVKLALLEKNLPFEEVASPPSQDSAMLARSPMGKVPYIMVEGKCLAESQAILEYLEDVHPTPALYPADPWERAKVRELIQVIELYVDWPGRPLIGGVFFGASLSDETKAAAWAALERGAAALGRVARFGPFIGGEALTLADCAAYAHLRLASVLSNAVYGKDILAAVPGAAAYLERLAQRPAFARVTQDQAQAVQAFMARKKG